MRKGRCVSEKLKRFTIFWLIFTCFMMVFQTGAVVKTVYAMPFYGLKPEKIVLRSSFYTTYSSSSEERKSNIKLCAKSINNTLVDVNGEFSFNTIVGPRTEKRGYKQAKIIVNGEFVDGVGGGVCQVSTTLYNAVLLAGLEVLECHPHSLPVSYVAPSFDAMVNSGWADLKFKNCTDNPIIIKTCADEQTLKISIYGQAMDYKVNRVSYVTEKILPLPEQIVFDEDGDYPELYEGEKMFLRYGKEGYKSEGYIEKIKNGKVESVKKIRTDKYSAVRGLVVYGKALRKDSSAIDDEDVYN